MANQKIVTEIPTVPTLNLKSVTLSSSNFRKGLVEKTSELKMEMKISVTDGGNNFLVSEQIRLFSGEAEGFLFEVEMMAEFEKVGDFTGSLEEFGNINGAAIIYAYIRQHVSTLTLEAGMKPIILPLINFVDHYYKNKK